MRGAYVAQPSRLIAPEDEKKLLNKLLHDPRGERHARRRDARDTSSVTATHQDPSAGATVSGICDDTHCFSKDEAAAAAIAITMPSRDDRQAAWSRFDIEGTGALSFDEIDQLAVELFCDRACQTRETLLQAMVLAYQTVPLRCEGWVERCEFTLFLQHVVYFADSKVQQQLKRAEAECKCQKGRLTLNEFLRAAAAANAAVAKSTAVEDFRTLATKELIDGGNSVTFGAFCQWCAHHHISQV